MWRLPYADVLNQELVNNQSYTSTTLSEHDLVAGHLEQFKAGINIKCRKLPTMYWISELHSIVPDVMQILVLVRLHTFLIFDLLFNQNQGTYSTL